jgi:Ca2+/Na+ antiporter
MRRALYVAGRAAQFAACLVALVASIILIVIGAATLLDHGSFITHLAGLSTLLAGLVLLGVAFEVAIHAIRRHS